MLYRREIDGLRAIAVIAVFLFHLKFRVFSGGYVGVDIFFVISGYLITEIIKKKLEDGTFSFLEFYERRLRRIIPAFFLIILITQIFTYLFFLSHELINFCKSLLASLFFYSNIYFWRQDSYFDAQNEIAPLLNIWSLSIEEQFYFLYPLFLFVIFRFFKKYKLFIYLFFFLLSFCSSIWITIQDPNSGFYLPHLRAWELMLGGLLSWKILPIFKQQLINKLLVLFGFILIFFPIFCYTKTTLFPGFYAIFPCLGTMLILHFTKDRDSYFKQMLSSRIAVFYGKISYSLYLWHWPAIVFAQYYLMSEFSLIDRAVLVIVITFLSYLSYLYIELPARNKVGIFKDIRLFIVAIFFVIAVSASISYYTIYVYNGFPGRFSDKIQKYDNGKKDTNPDGTRKCLHLDNNDNINICKIGNNQTKKPAFILYGDSFAHTIIPVLRFLADKHNVTGLASAVPQCRPGLGVYSSNKFMNYISCPEFNNKMLKIIKKNKIKHVILFARWPQKFSGPNYAVTNNLASVMLGLDNILSSLKNDNVKVWIVGKIPHPNFNVPSYLARYEMFNRDKSTLIKSKEDFFTYQNADFDKMINILKQKHSVEYIDISKILCPDKCLIELDGHALYTDKSHLSVFASMHIQDAFNEFFKAVSEE